MTYTNILDRVQNSLVDLPEVLEAAVVLDRRTDPPQRIGVVVGHTSPDFIAEPGEVLVELGTGHRVSSVNPHETLFQYREIFEQQIYTLEALSYPKDAVVLDVGANIGMFALFIAQHIPKACIVSFEPVDTIRAHLTRNLARYAPTAQVLPYGLAAREETVEFTSYKGYSMMSSRSVDANPEEEKASITTAVKNAVAAGDRNSAIILDHLDVILSGRFEEQRSQCRLRRLSDVIDELGLDWIDVLKIDVQRAELDVLLGLEPRHLDCIGAVVMEIHDDGQGKTKGRTQQIKQMLTDAGFAVTLSQDEQLRGTDRWDCVAVKDSLNLAHRHPVTIPPEPVRLDSAIDEQTLKSRLSDLLPDADMPQRILVLDKLPKTERGLVDEDAVTTIISKVVDHE